MPCIDCIDCARLWLAELLQFTQAIRPTDKDHFGKFPKDMCARLLRLRMQLYFNANHYVPPHRASCGASSFKIYIANNGDMLCCQKHKKPEHTCTRQWLKEHFQSMSIPVERISCYNVQHFHSSYRLRPTRDASKRTHDFLWAINIPAWKVYLPENSLRAKYALIGAKYSVILSLKCSILYNKARVFCVHSLCEKLCRAYRVRIVDELALKVVRLFALVSIYQCTRQLLTVLYDLKWCYWCIWDMQNRMAVCVPVVQPRAIRSP